MHYTQKHIQKEIDILAAGNFQNLEWKFLNWSLDIDKMTGRVKLMVFVGDHETGEGEWREKVLW